MIIPAVPRPEKSLHIYNIVQQGDFFKRNISHCPKEEKGGAGAEFDQKWQKKRFFLEK